MSNVSEKAVFIQATMTQEVAEINRELALRKAAYPKMVASGRYTQEQADEFSRIMDSAKRRIGCVKHMKARLSPGQVNALNALVALMDDDIQKCWSALWNNPEITYDGLPLMQQATTV